MPADDLEDAFKQYVQTALRSSTDDGGQPLDRHFDVSGIDQDTRKAVLEDVSRFLRKNQALIDRAGLSASDVGHKFWLSRNGHGSGFWDVDDYKNQDVVKTGRQLHEATKRFGQYDLMVGDDGFLHGSSGRWADMAASSLDVLAAKIERNTRRS